jgi:hypothetical protein
MASSGKKKTTMAKLSREAKLRERRVEKKMRKEARRLLLAENPNAFNDLESAQTTESDEITAPTPRPQESQMSTGMSRT